MKRVMVFGTFDGIHEGHRAMLKEAKSLGDYLIVALAQDHMVEHLKGHLPKLNFVDRFEHLEKEDGVDKVVIGDAHIGIWGVVEKYQPDVVALGYDQSMLQKDLARHFRGSAVHPEVRVMRSFEPEKYHSSILEKPLANSD